MSQIILEQSMKNTLEAVIAMHPHAIALVGEKGRGKSFIAAYIARQLLGTKPSIENNPYYIAVDARKSGIEDVREVQQTLSLQIPGTTPIRRVVVFEHFDNFGHEAQNSLLKTLEEPPSTTMIIITIDVVSNVLPTILSRVQQIPIPALTLDTLKQQLNSDEALLTRSFLMSDGSAGTLFGLLENQQEHPVARSIEVAKNILQKPAYVRLAQIDSFTKKNDIPPEALLDGIIRVLQASFRQLLATSNSTDRQISMAHKRLTQAVEALNDLNNGVSAKLVLSRLFISL